LLQRAIGFAPRIVWFAVAETLSHLEQLVREGRAARGGDDRAVTYTERSLDDEKPPSTCAPGVGA